MNYTVSSGNRSEHIEAEDPMEAAVIFCLVGVGMLIQVKPDGDEECFVSSAVALDKAAKMMKASTPVAREAGE